MFSAGLTYLMMKPAKERPVRSCIQNFMLPFVPGPLVTDCCEVSEAAEQGMRLIGLLLWRLGLAELPRNGMDWCAVCALEEAVCSGGIEEEQRMSLVLKDVEKREGSVHRNTQGRVTRADLAFMAGCMVEMACVRYKRIVGMWVWYSWAVVPLDLSGASTVVSEMVFRIGNRCQ